MADLLIQWKKQLATGRSPRRRITDGLVLTNDCDPYYVGANDGHVLGQWMVDALDNLGIYGLHFRGIHYKLVSHRCADGTVGYRKPDGTNYTNTEKDWEWLQNGPGKAGRWLGYVPFDRIRDERNAEPTIIIRGESVPTSQTNAGVGLDLPSIHMMLPLVYTDDFDRRQKYRLVIVGEKSSLGAVLRPISDELETDLFLPTGELSDTMIYRLVEAADNDGRPTIVFYVSDCDPSGWQMPISLSRKVQALNDSLFLDADIEVRRIALTPDQVLAENLPSSPLKAEEERAEDWIAAMGVEQTEVDAVDEDVMERWVREALAPFFDDGHARRISDAEEEWREEAQDALNAAIGAEKLDALDKAITKQIETMQRQWQKLRERSEKLLGEALPNFTPPLLDVPEPEYDDVVLDALDPPLFTTTDWYLAATWKLKASKAYVTTSETMRIFGSEVDFDIPDDE